MARRRSRARRKGLALLALLVVLGLLELNQFLPGGWPGGGGDDGFRRFAVDAPDHDRLRPAEDDLPPLPPEGLVVVVQGGGSGLEVAADRPGAEAQALSDDGSARLLDPGVLASGFVVRDGETTVRHGPADPTLGEPWTVHWPTALAALEDTGEGRLAVTVRAAEDGRPLAHALVEVRTPEGVQQAHTAEDGVLAFDVPATRARITASAPGRGTVVHWIHPEGVRTLELALPASAPVVPQLVDAEDGAPLTAQRLRLLDAHQTVLWEGGSALDGLPSGTRPEDLDGALLEVHVQDRPVVRVPLASALGRPLRIPRGCVQTVEALDAKAARLRGARVTARYAPPHLLAPAGSAPREPFEVEVVAGTQVVVPRNTPFRLLVEADASAPIVVRGEAGEADATHRPTLAPGHSLLVRVTTEDGAAADGARVVVHADAGGARITREARTRADGTVRVSELPHGIAAVYAITRGHAWALTTATPAVPPARVELVLPLARTLRIVVETPLGLPVEGVRVVATPAGEDLPDVVAPDATSWRTSSEGTLVLRTLHDRAYRLRLAKPGWRTVVADAIRPGSGVHFFTLQRLE